ncbi:MULTISPECIES: DUF934 domain-containing protein [Filomicrobium]|uniref:Uncharacterized conserved protein, DUF934 family n=1 Tax=Filomicrobium insigne TaxID=418854 RepID=A0A1H0U086_9HYPH|nr:MULTISPECIES: DUF934 domain-containing protein [Filomicrobium]MCV0370529.1 DUF934 domain-containing protein [Filomicrobium sp.]SDP59687.1 Uncharacterized conserved protein, DUF934 family [Filomicrobium insigne]
MPIYRGGAFVDDTWRVLGDDEVADRGAHVIVSLERWRSEPQLRTGNVGVILRAGEEPDVIADGLVDAPLIVITFAKFTDGRGYSVARALRERHAFKGEIRATGDVLLDQIPLMLRCGFDAFEITHGPTIAALGRGYLPGLALSYQRPVGGSRRYSTVVRPSQASRQVAQEQNDGAGQA